MVWPGIIVDQILLNGPLPFLAAEKAFDLVLKLVYLGRTGSEHRHEHNWCNEAEQFVRVTAHDSRGGNVIGALDSTGISSDTLLLSCQVEPADIWQGTSDIQILCLLVFRQYNVNMMITISGLFIHYTKGW